MKLTTLTVAAVLTGSAAFAADTGPADVKFSEDGAVEMSLTGKAGDAAEGRNVFADRKLGNCLACHVNTEMPEQSFHGEVGPPLDGAADRWTVAELRGIVTNSRMTFEDTIMPRFYINAGYYRPLEDFDGASILTAQQVEDVVAYLLTLKE